MVDPERKLIDSRLNFLRELNFEHQRLVFHLGDRDVKEQWADFQHWYALWQLREGHISKISVGFWPPEAPEMCIAGEIVRYEVSMWDVHYASRPNIIDTYIIGPSHPGWYELTEVMFQAIRSAHLEAMEQQILAAMGLEEGDPDD